MWQGNSIKLLVNTTRRSFSNTPPTWLNGVDMEAFKKTLMENPGKGGLNTKVATDASVSKESVISKASLETIEPKSSVNKFFDASSSRLNDILPEGSSRTFVKAMDITKHWMLRKTTSEILSKLSNFKNSSEKSKLKFMLDGKTGVGKSVALGQIIDYCRSSDWLVFHVPKARDWCYHGFYVEKSKVIPDKFDVAGLGDDLLSSFLSAHSDKLAELPLDDAEKYSTMFNVYQREFTGTTLKDLVEFGIKYPETSCVAIVELRSQLNRVTTYPVLIAIDEYNWWHFDTVFGFKGKAVKPSDISVISAFSDFGETNQDMENGVFIGATTDTFKTRMDLRNKIDYKKYKRTFKNYNSPELASVLDYYEEMGFIYTPNDDNLINSVHLMTNGNPWGVFQRVAVL